MKKPCNECPFLKTSLNGWLGGFNIDDTLSCALSESDFICHITREEEKQHQCVGRLLFAKKSCKMFKNKTLEEQKNIVVEVNDLDEILTYKEFKEHHKPKTLNV